MRYPASEKAEIIKLVEGSHLPAKATLQKLGIPRATFYRWCGRWREGGPEALADHRSRPDRVWNRIPDDIRDQIIKLALEAPELSPRELAVRFIDERRYFVSEASVYRLLKVHDLIPSPAYVVIKAADEFKDKTTAINQLWQTELVAFRARLRLTYLKITGWGWYYLSTVLDHFSRYIVAWKLCATMRADDVTATLDLALKASGLNHATVLHRPRLLSDNGSSYVAEDLAKCLEGKGMGHIRGAPYHPQTQGKIERWHQTLKNRILLANYYLPRDLEQRVAAFVSHYNHARYHESLNNVTPADVYLGRAAETRVHTGASRRFEPAGLERACWSNATPIRAIFKREFQRAGLPYFNPHSIRNTLVRFGQSSCRSPEEFKAWSQNLGHEDVLTTLTSYGQVDRLRQREVILGFGGPACA